MAEQTALERKLATILPQLTERQRRVLLGAEARALGRGGISQVAAAARVSRTTIHAALAELDQPTPDTSRSRRPGGGRKPQQVTDATLVRDLEALIEPQTRGD